MKRNTIKKKLVLKKSVRNFISRILVTIIIVLIGMIVIKEKPNFKNTIIKNIYENSLKFTKTKQLYQKYFGNILSLDKIVKEEQAVFNEKLDYKNSKDYKDGVELEVNNNYMVPILESGIVVFIGEKEDYGTTVVIDQIDGISVSYSNVTINNIKLYDYVEKGKLLGETKSNKLYLTFQKDGKYLDYKKYI